MGTTTKFARTLSKIPGCSSLAMIPCLVSIFNLLPLVCLFQFTVFEFFFQLISTRFKNLLLNLPFFVSSAKILQFFLFGSPDRLFLDLFSTCFSYSYPRNSLTILSELFWLHCGKMVRWSVGSLSSERRSLICFFNKDSLLRIFIGNLY